MKEKNVYSNIKKLNLFWFFHNLIFAYVIERLFAIERGLSVQQMVYLEIIYAFSIVVLEIPTGLLSDSWSRKNVMILSSFFDILGAYLFCISHSFWGFAVGIFFQACTTALYSGTSNAIYYDSLKQVEKERDFEKTLSFCGIGESIAALSAALIGSWTAIKFGYTFNYYLSLISVVISFLVAFSLVEPKRSFEKSEEKEEVVNKSEILSFFRENNFIYYILIAIVAMSSTITYVDEYWQIYFKEISIPVAFFGVYSVCREVLSSISKFLAYKLKEKFALKNILLTCLIFSGVVVSLAGVVKNIFGIFLILSVFVCLSLVEILSMGYIHNKIESKFRATIESVFSLFNRVFVILIGLIFGYFSTNYSIFISFIFLGLTILFFVFLLLIKIDKIIGNNTRKDNLN